MNRLDRLQSILLRLQARKVVKAQDIADEFRISLRTVYRDMRSLEEAGVPLIAEAGWGYSIVEGYHLPPVMFSKEEAAALLTAEKLLRGIADRSTNLDYGHAMEKIRAVLRTPEKEFVDTLSQRIHVLELHQVAVQEFPNGYMREVQQALVEEKVLCIEYYSWYNETTTRRDIAPIGIIHYAAHWHLIAWCKTRKDYRDFRMDRIRSLHPTGEKRIAGKKDELQDYLERTREKEKMFCITVCFDKAVARQLQEQKYYYGWVSEQEVAAGMEMTFLQGSLDYFSRWLLCWGSGAQIIAPLELHDKVRGLVTTLATQYHS